MVAAIGRRSARRAQRARPAGAGWSPISPPAVAAAPRTVTRLPYDPAEVRAHVQRLAAAGVGYRTLAAAAGVGSKTVSDIRRGSVARPHRRTAAALLAIPVTAGPRLVSDRRMVDVQPTRRRIEGILALGVDRKVVARAIPGSSRQKTLRCILRGDRNWVTIATARAVALLAAAHGVP